MEHGYPTGVLTLLADRMEDCGGKWVVGGSTGLALRGARLERPPRDLDVYADRNDVPEIHRRLADYAVDVPARSETDRYRSILSHYSIEGTVVELVGGFEVSAAGTRYRTEVAHVLYPHGKAFDVNGRRVTVVPLAHELLFNVLRSRDDRSELIAAMMREQPDFHLPILNGLLERNEVSDDTKRRVLKWIGSDGQGKKAEME